MAIAETNKTVMEFVELWGIEIEGLSSVTITIVPNNLVTIDAVYQDPKREYGEIIKHYALAELKNE